MAQAMNGAQRFTPWRRADLSGTDGQGTPRHGLQRGGCNAIRLGSARAVDATGPAHTRPGRPVGRTMVPPGMSASWRPGSRCGGWGGTMHRSGPLRILCSERRAPNAFGSPSNARIDCAITKVLKSAWTLAPRLHWASAGRTDEHSASPAHRCAVHQSLGVT